MTEGFRADTDPIEQQESLEERARYLAERGLISARVTEGLARHSRVGDNPHAVVGGTVRVEFSLLGSFGRP